MNPSKKIQCPHITVFLLAISASLLSAPPASAQFPVKISIEIFELFTVAPRDDGFIAEFNAFPGRTLKTGEEILRFDSRKLDLEIAKVDAELRALGALANDNSGVELAIAQRISTSENYSQLQKIMGLTNIPKLEMVRARSSLAESDAQLGLAEVEHKKAQLDFQAKLAELKLLEYQKENLVVSASCEGVIAEVFQYQGDFVSKGTPIAQIYRMDKLAGVALFEQAQLPIQSAVGRAIQVELSPTSSRTFKIVRVSPRVDAADSYRAYFEVDNEFDQEKGQWNLLPGIVFDGELIPKTK